MTKSGTSFAADGVRSVRRALQLLRLMNTRAVWSLGELARTLGLPKTTVFRLLQTLEEEGCVRSPAGSHGLYRLCSAVKDLASGVTFDSALADLAAPVVIAGTRRLRWPLSVGVFDDCYVRVICCGMPYSRLAAKTTTLNRRYWMFTSALGRAYFAFSDRIEQEIIIERAAQLLDEHGIAWPYADSQLAADVRQIRREGHSVRWAGPRDPTSAIAVPVRTADELLGSLVCSTYPKSLNARRIAELRPELDRAAAEISSRWQASGRRTHEKLTA